MGWVSQATEKVSEAATQALQPIEKGLSQGITDLGKTIANSPALETAITAIAAYYQVPPEATAAFLAANKTSQTGGNLEKGLETLVLSYGAGKLLTTGIDLNAAEAAATGGGGDVAIVDAALSGADTAIAASQPVMAGGLLTSGAPSILTAGSAPGALAATEAAYLTSPSAGVLAGASGAGLGSTLAGLGGSPVASRQETSRLNGVPCGYTGSAILQLRLGVKDIDLFCNRKAQQIEGIDFRINSLAVSKRFR